MECYGNEFIQFEQIISPIIRTEGLSRKSTRFGLGYKSLNDESNDFIMKFKIISPWNNIEAIKIIHGYVFRVQDKFIVNHHSEKLADFFAFLVEESLREVNKTLEKGKIEIPQHRSLVNAIFLMLVSKSN